MCVVTQILGVFDQVFGPVAQILGSPADTFDRSAIAAADGMTYVLATAGCQQQRNSGADPDPGDQKSNVPRPSAFVFIDRRRGFVILETFPPAHDFLLKVFFLRPARLILAVAGFTVLQSLFRKRPRRESCPHPGRRLEKSSSGQTEMGQFSRTDSFSPE